MLSLRHKTRQFGQSRNRIAIGDRSRQIENPSLSPIRKDNLHVLCSNRRTIAGIKEQLGQFLLKRPQLNAGPHEYHLPCLRFQCLSRFSYALVDKLQQTVAAQLAAAIALKTKKKYGFNLFEAFIKTRPAIHLRRAEQEEVPLWKTLFEQLKEPMTFSFSPPGKIHSPALAIGQKRLGFFPCLAAIDVQQLRERPGGCGLEPLPLLL